MILAAADFVDTELMEDTDAVLRTLVTSDDGLQIRKRCRMRSVRELYLSAYHVPEIEQHRQAKAVIYTAVSLNDFTSFTARKISSFTACFVMSFSLRYSCDLSSEQKLYSI